MGDKEFIGETSSPSGEAELLPTSASEPAAAVSKPVLAGGDAGTTETKAAIAAPNAAAAAEPITAVRNGAFASCDAADGDDAVVERTKEASSVSRFAVFAAHNALAAALREMSGAHRDHDLAPPTHMGAAAGPAGLEDKQALREYVARA